MQHLEVIARVCQAAARELLTCVTQDDEHAVDVVPKDWDHLHEDSKQAELESIEYLLDHPAYGAAAAHNEWVRQQTARGWEYGDKFDAKAKKDPMLIPFGRLTPRTQTVANLRRKIIESLGQNLGR